MRLYLIRHGETVDNVANLYAGSRDSELTNHGVQQATRLGQHFAATPVQFTHIFSSHLKRAVKTAELVHKAQPEVHDDQGNIVPPLVAQFRELAEQDFGSLEGISYLTRQPESRTSGNDRHRGLHKGEPEFVDIESEEAITQRIDIFLDNYLSPIVHTVSDPPSVVAIVSHGILLHSLWRRLLQRLPPQSVTAPPEILARYIDLDRIGSWSNTGYLELDVVYSDKQTVPTVQAESDGTPPAAGSSGPATERLSSTQRQSLQIFPGWAVTVHKVNSKAHLDGLKRTGGGVGSAAHDDKQKSIDTFFKKRQV